MKLAIPPTKYEGTLTAPSVGSERPGQTAEMALITNYTATIKHKWLATLVVT